MDKSKAKMMMLKSLSKEMSDMMREGYSENAPDSLKDKMMKVTVAADSKDGLEKGLSKAQQIMKKKMMMSEDCGEDCEGCPKCEEESEE